MLVFRNRRRMSTRFVDTDHILTATVAGSEVKIAASRHDLTHLLGTRTESISRAFYSRADAGAVEILESDRFLRKNAKILADEAGEDAIETTVLLTGLAASRQLLR